MITTILTFLIESKIGRTIAISGAIIIGALISWAVFAKHYENIGYQKALSAIAAQDQKVKGKTDAAHKSVQDCFDSGGDWDVTSGLCNK